MVQITTRGGVYLGNSPDEQRDLSSGVQAPPAAQPHRAWWFSSLGHVPKLVFRSLFTFSVRVSSKPWEDYAQQRRSVHALPQSSRDLSAPHTYFCGFVKCILAHVRDLKRVSHGVLWTYTLPEPCSQTTLFTIHRRRPYWRLGTFMTRDFRH